MTDKTTWKDTELALWRSGLVARKTRAHNVTQAAKEIARAANAIRRVNLEACNGVPKWDARLQSFHNGLDDNDMARHEKTTEKARKTIEQAARDVLTRGLVFKWYTDPRAGCAVRISDTANRRDCFL